MKNQEKHQKEHTISYWIRNLVGSAGMFSINLIITVAGGSIYSFGVWPSQIALLIFGVVSPLIFTLCLYYSIRHLAENIQDEMFPKIFKSRSGNYTIMVFDMSIILGLAILIHLNYINYFIFRLLQTVIFPMLMLFILRFLYVNQLIDGNRDS